MQSKEAKSLVAETISTAKSQKIGRGRNALQLGSLQGPGQSELELELELELALGPVGYQRLSLSLHRTQTAQLDSRS